ncbi:hypothetical protein F383_16235 [Gossypium arboreum]|uniref:Uncharacterized protein n=1 Tax=Gossypium arboreum TaxID=29729 RepID=A0A0B0PZ87_GOSAR|nr:hypothetical protein F383_16235 [Gossypium arboreum]
MIFIIYYSKGLPLGAFATVVAPFGDRDAKGRRTINVD